MLFRESGSSGYCTFYPNKRGSWLSEETSLWALGLRSGFLSNTKEQSQTILKALVKEGVNWMDKSPVG